VPDPYGWYWMTSATGAPRSPTVAEVLALVSIPLLLVAVCIVLAARERIRSVDDQRDGGAPLRRRDQRRLAEIERHLSHDDPELARQLCAMRLRPVDPVRRHVQSPQRQELET
jgi:hypothetical protein